MKKYSAVLLAVMLVISTFPYTVLAEDYTPPTSYSAPANVGVVFFGDELETNDSGRWSFDIGYGATEETRELAEALADGRFEDAGFNSLHISVQGDYKLDNDKWRSELPGYEDWVFTQESGFDPDEGVWVSSWGIYDAYFDEVFAEGILPGGKSYFDSHTMHFRVRFSIYFYNSDTGKGYEYYSPWSDEVSYSNNQKIEDPKALINHTPVLLTVELKEHDNGEPYLDFRAGKAHDDVQLLNSISDQRVYTNVWLKVNDGAWVDAGEYLGMKEQFTVDARDYFIDSDSYDEAVYEAKFRYTFDYDWYPAAGKTGRIESPFSNVISHGMPAYQGASAWAKTELDKAAEYGFITDKIKGNMKGSITREEFAEVAMKLYEKYSGKPAEYKDMSAFVDTQNPEIFKAYDLGIVNGTDLLKKLFSPADLTNREQVAAMLYRAVKAIKPDADMSTAGAESFADEDNISNWALESVKFMSKNGFIKGSDGKFDPQLSCTREMAVLIAVRVYEKYAGISN